MSTVNFTSALNRFFPNLKATEIQAQTVAQALDHLEVQYPGIKDYIVDDSGALRKHINIFIGDQLIQDRIQLSDTITAQDEILIFQALSGG